MTLFVRASFVLSVLALTAALGAQPAGNVKPLTTRNAITLIVAANEEQKKAGMVGWVNLKDGDSFIRLFVKDKTKLEKMVGKDRKPATFAEFKKGTLVEAAFVPHGGQPSSGGTFADAVHILLLPEADQPKSAYSLKDVAWFAGQWRSPVSDALNEEHWSAPSGGAMMGMFRAVRLEKTVLFEFLLMEESADGVFMRLRHFKAGMAELEKEPVRLKLTKASAREAVFENPDNEKPKRITYSLGKDEKLTVTVETTRDGKSATFSLVFERVKK
ncbi:MAG: hypothetical protein HY289_15710 [Planctomycetes bacterium]|nr:hypothetical protein [Planctomycetota bacterium]